MAPRALRSGSAVDRAADDRAFTHSTPGRRSAGPSSSIHCQSPKAQAALSNGEGESVSWMSNMVGTRHGRHRYAFYCRLAPSLNDGLQLKSLVLWTTPGGRLCFCFPRVPRALVTRSMLLQFRGQNGEMFIIYTGALVGSSHGSNRFGKTRISFLNCQANMPRAKGIVSKSARLNFFC